MKKIFSSVCLLLLFHPCCYSQTTGQQLIDSLHAVLQQHHADDTDKVKLLSNIAYNYPYINPVEGIKFGKQALELAEKHSWQSGIASANSAIGQNYTAKADYANSLEYQYKALKIYEQLKDKPMEAVLLRNIAIVHHTSKNQQKSLEYNLKSLHMYESLNDKEGIAAIYNNMSNVFYSLREMDSVLAYNLKSLHLFEEIKNSKGTARMLGNIANFYAETGEFNKAMVYYFDALRKEKALGNENGVTRNLGNIGETYLDISKEESGSVKPDSLIPAGRAANLQKALQYLKTTIDNSKALQQTEYFLAFGEVLSEAYLLTGNYKDAMQLYQDYISVRDSVYDVEKYNEATRREMDYEYGKREDSIRFDKQLTDVKLSEEKKSRSREQIFYLCGIALVLVFSAFMFNRWRVTRAQKKIIEKEKKRSDELLLNILPEETAEELKETGTAKAKSFEMVSVMFTDFKNFTQASEKLSAEELVKEIDSCFSEFDKIITRYGIEKIKTIGDSYMCAAGLPIADLHHAEKIVKAGLEMQQFIERNKQQRIAGNKIYFELRLGIHSGSVVAGVVGTKKFAYDIWGDTVNTASRMESSSEVGKVNISGATYELVKNKFNCIHRGKIQAKNKGAIDMYFIDSNIKFQNET